MLYICDAISTDKVMGTLFLNYKVQITVNYEVIVNICYSFPPLFLIPGSSVFMCDRSRLNARISIAVGVRISGWTLGNFEVVCSTIWISGLGWGAVG